MGRRVHTDTFVDAVALQVPAARVSVQRSRRRERPARRRPPRIRVGRLGRLRRRPVLRHRLDVRQGGTRGHLHRRRVHQPRSRSCRSSRATDVVVPQHMGVGTRRSPPVVAARRRPGRSVTRLVRAALARCRRCDRSVLVVLRQRNEFPAPLRIAELDPISERRDQRPRRARHRHDQPGQERHEGRRLVPAHHRRRQNRDGAPASRPRPARRSVRRLVRRNRGGPARRGRRVLRGTRTRGRACGARRAAAGHRGIAVGKEALSLRRHRMAPGRPRFATPSCRS